MYDVFIFSPLTGGCSEGLDEYATEVPVQLTRLINNYCVQHLLTAYFSSVVVCFPCFFVFEKKMLPCTADDGPQGSRL